MSDPSFDDSSVPPSAALAFNPPALSRLSPRQRQILAGLLTAQAPKQIARDLGLSIHTVRDHIQKIYKKFGVSGREELMALFLPADPARGMPI